MLLNSLRPDAFDRQFLFEAADGRQDIIEAAERIREAVIACSILLEQGGGTLTADQINQLFTNAQAISQGKKPGGGFLGKAAGAVKGAAGAVGNLMKVIQDSAKKLQNTEPVQNFDAKVSEILGKWKENLGDDHKAVKLAQTFGQYASKNPKKTAFAIAVLSGLTGAIATPGAGAAMGAALRGAVGLMKGEKASTVLAKAGLHAGIGGAAGFVGDMVAQSDTMAAIADKIGINKLKELVGGGSAAIKGADPAEFEHWSTRIRTYNPPGQTGAIAFVPDNISDLEKALGDKGPKFLEAWKLWRENGLEWRGNIGEYPLADADVREKLMRYVGVDPNQAQELAGQHPSFNEKNPSFPLKEPEGGGAVDPEEARKKSRMASRRAEMKHGLTGRARRESIEFSFPRLDEAIMGKKGVSMQALQQAWQQAGSPSDLMSNYKVLKQSGLDDNQIKQTFTSVGVEWEDVAMGGDEQQQQQQQQAKPGEPAAAQTPQAGSWYASQKFGGIKNQAVELASSNPEMKGELNLLISQEEMRRRQKGKG